MSTTAVLFPPYGIMDNDYLKNLGAPGMPPAKPVVPPDFIHVRGETGDERLARWIDFRDETLGMLTDVVWPAWDPDTNSWKGEAAAPDHMLELTRADLDILVSIRNGPAVLPLDSVPSSKVRAVNCPTHRSFFTEEDPGKIFTSYQFYDRTLASPVSPQTLSDAFFPGLLAKCSSTQLQFKARMQRPRAYQMAFLLGERKFTWEEATSSMTPSMVSGHSLQGLLGVGAVMEQILDTGVELSAESWEALGQYAVDIGDRRVMAGVHYPSDNLASWIVLMRMANRVFHLPAIKDKLWAAITQRSLVYQLVANSKAPVYRPVLDLLSRVRMEKQEEHR